MTTKQSTLPRLPIIFTAGVLSAGLLLSGCSNNDMDTESADTAGNSDDTAAVVDTPEESTTAQEKEALDSNADSEQPANNAKDKTDIDSDNINPVTSSAKQKSLVTNKTQTNTPEDTVKQALDSLYYGDVKQAATYYKVDMANFEEELAKTQSAFQQTVDSVTITDTTYNDDKTHATITGELMLKEQSEPAPLIYELQKINDEWKILG